MAETVTTETVTEQDDGNSAAGESADTLGAEISLALEKAEDDTKSVKSGKSFKSLKGSIAGSLRRFSMGSKMSGMNWRSSQFSIDSRTTNDYMDPVQRKTRKTIGKIIVREEHTEWIKSHILQDMTDLKLQLSNLCYFSDKHPEFPGLTFDVMMTVIDKDMKAMEDYMDMMNARIEILGYSPSPSPPPTPPRLPTPNFVEKFFCWHRYVPSDSEEEGGEEEDQQGQQGQQHQDEQINENEQVENGAQEVTGEEEEEEEEDGEDEDEQVADGEEEEEEEN